MTAPMAAGALIHPPAAPMARAQTGTVYPWQCDQWGHMNVQYYAQFFGEAVAHALNAAGCGPSRLQALQAAAFPRRQRVWYRREFRLGDVVLTDAAALPGRPGQPGTVTILARMREAIAGQPATDTVIDLGLDAAEGFAARDWPADALPGLADPAALPAELAGAGLLEPWPAELPAQAHPRMRESLRGVINTWDCDHHGGATTRSYFGAFSDAALGLMTALGLDPKDLLAAGLSSAALEYRVIYDRRLRAGDAYVMHTGLAESGRKAWRFVHVMADAATGETVARADVVGVYIDAAARRAVPLPDWVKARTDPIRID